MSPNTAQDWLAVAKERASDAEAIHKQYPNSVGAIYLAGYAIECTLKALLQKRGISYPTSGREGHNLQGLWKAARFQFSDLQDTQGTQTFFLEKWSTDLRYETALPVNIGLEVQELMTGAKHLSGRIRTEIRRSKPRKKP
jgi:hypothetical protein